MRSNLLQANIYKTKNIQLFTIKYYNRGCLQQNAKLEAEVERPRKGGGTQVVKVRFAELLNESRECFKKENICN